MSSGTLINVVAGTDCSYEPATLAAVLSNKFHTAPGSASPNLTDAAPSSVVVVEDEVIHSTWTHGVNAVSAVFMHDSVFNEYFTATELNAATGLVFTFPTKPFYAASESDNSTTTRSPFTGAVCDDHEPVGSGATGPLLADGSSTGACEGIQMHRDGRELEQNAPPLSDIDFIPPFFESGSLCWTANIITFGNVLNSANAVAIDSHPRSRDGWIQVGFFNSPGYMLTSAEGHQYFALPVIGFAVHKYVNGNVGSVLSNYVGASRTSTRR